MSEAERVVESTHSKELRALYELGRREPKDVRRSVEYIIANIPYKRSIFDGGIAAAYNDCIDSLEAVCANDRATDFWQYVPDEQRSGSSWSVIDDRDMVIAETVLEDIRRAMLIWNETNRKEIYSEAVFYEYILPYRIDREPLDMQWRRRAYDDYGRYLEIGQSVVYQCISLNRNIPFKIYTAFRNAGERTYAQYAAAQRGTCNDQCLYTAMIMRSVGIPVALDIIPHWGNHNLGHSMNALILPDGSSCGFNSTKDLEDGLKLAYKVPKVYRRTFTIQKHTPVFKNRDNETIPPCFADFSLRDVTAEYDVPAADIEVSDIFGANDGQTGYLTVADRYSWEAVAWGERCGKSFRLANVGYGYNAGQQVCDKGEDLGEGILYLPVKYDAFGIVPINYPFILSANGICYLNPDTTNSKSVKLLRKYPKFDRIRSFASDLELCVVEGANKSDFSDAEILHTITDAVSHMQEVPMAGNKPYRYVRLLKRGGGFSISELAFYDNEGCKLKGEIISHKVLTGEEMLNNIFDGNVLTYFYGAGGFRNLWIGLRFDKPQYIGKIAYCPRTDDNDVKPEDVYELSYWNGNSWTGLGVVKASDYEITYDNVPDNALLILRNLTEGVEERPFTYENGRQIWW